LKAANPNVKPVRNTPKNKKISEKKKTEMPTVGTYTPKLSGTTPSPRPKPHETDYKVSTLVEPVTDVYIDKNMEILNMEIFEVPEEIMDSSPLNTKKDKKKEQHD